MDQASIISLIAVAVVAIFSSVTAPLILARRTERMRREDRQADWDRQDRAAALLLAKQEEQATAIEKARVDLLQTQEEQAAAAEAARVDLAASQAKIAGQAAEAAHLLADAQAETIRRSDEVAALAAERDSKVSLKLEKLDAQAQRIHTLVNSDMTAARESERHQTQEMAAVLRRVIGLAESRGQVPEQGDVDALAAAEARSTELDQILADRMAQQRIVEAEAARPGAVDLDSPARTGGAGEGGA